MVLLFLSQNWHPSINGRLIYYSFVFQVVHVERVYSSLIQTKIDRPIRLDKQLIIEGSPHLYRLVAAIEHRSEHISNVRF